MVLPTGSLLAWGPSISELPEHVQGLLNVPGQGDGIEGGELRGQRMPLRGGEGAGGPQSLVRGLGGVVALHDLAPDPVLAQQFADRAEEVVLEAEQTVEALQDRPRRAGAEAVVADEAAHEQAVALLDPGLVILAIGAPAGEADAVVAAPAEQGGIDELAAVVAVPGPQGEGQARVEVLDGACDPLMVQVVQGLQLGPAGGHVDGDQRCAVAPRGGLATVQHQIALQGARRDAGPLAPGAQGRSEER